MRRLPHVALLGAVLVFALGVWQLLLARFASGDIYPVGSSLRSDALGVRAFYAALSEALPTPVTRHRGGRGSLARARNATIILSHFPVARLNTEEDPLIDELSQAARGGARVVLALDERQARGTVARQSCSGPEMDPELGRKRTQRKSFVSCERTAVELWGFAVGRVPHPRGTAARAESAETSLPQTIPWHASASFAELEAPWHVVYSRDGQATVIERPFGRGTLVLMAESYLLTNEAQRADRASGLLVWLVGHGASVIFDESHLGVIEPRGIMDLARDLRLHGFFAGAAMVAGLFVWQRLKRPPVRRRCDGSRGARGLEPADSLLQELMRRAVSPATALEACMAEARSLGLPVRREPTRGLTEKEMVEIFNLTFCAREERHAPR
jgi:hypothetical protein